MISQDHVDQYNDEGYTIEGFKESTRELLEINKLDETLDPSVELIQDPTANMINRVLNALLEKIGTQPANFQSWLIPLLHQYLCLYSHIL